MLSKKKIKAIFLDRDGVINEDTGYVSNLSEVRFLRGVFKAIKDLNKASFFFVIITNQAGIAKKKIRYQDYLEIEKYIERKIKRYSPNVVTYFCPHHKDAKIKSFRKNCFFRKPKPGMILHAAKKYNIDLKKSFLIGDKLTDIKAGKKAGVKNNFLISNRNDKKNFKNLIQASKYILKKK